MKLKELRYLLGFRPAPKVYEHVIRTFHLEKEGAVQYAQWLHPSESRKEITQESVDELRKFLSDGDVAIDIGAHTGDSTIPMALAVGKSGCVLALEPNPYVFPILKRNSEMNPASTNIVPLMFAATPQDGEMVFRYSDAGFCNGGRFEGMSQWLHGHAFDLKVRGTNLQALIRRDHPELYQKIRYIKVDTEGYELAVLQSLADLIADLKPFIKAEVYRKLNQQQRRLLFREIAAQGYLVRKIDDNGIHRGEILSEPDMNRWPHFDIFCEPV